MKIKEIILEGFKSYSERTTLSDLDPQFNAITGLNGSGKSNILEGICFLLGLQSWTLARVQTIRELIYKNGQAGIKQAAVTLVFCNKDKNTSPMGLEDLDEIKVTRIIKHDQTLYYLNSKKIPNNRVKAIFKSIGLNIDNYNTFFVQQGRIMSIVNFHPKELMSFIEETAGVSYYNQVKDNCMTTLEKKDDKLKRVDEIFEGDVRQDIERLEKEVENLRIWKRNELELKKVTTKQRFYERKLAQDESEKLAKEVEELEFNIKNIKKNITEKTHRLNEIVKELNKDKITGGDNSKTHPNEEEVKSLQNLLEKEEREQIRNKDSRRKLEQEASKLEMQLFKGKHNRENLIDKKRNLEWKTDMYKENIKKLKLELDNLKIISGQNTDKVGDFFIKNLASLKSELEDLQNQLQSVVRKIIGEESNLESLTYQKGNSQALQQTYAKTLDEKEAQYKILEKQIEKGEANTVDENTLSRKIGEFQQKVTDLHHKRRAVTNNNNNLFEIPFGNNRNLISDKSIYGRVHELFSVKDPEFLVALETIAGNKLFFIVVDNEDTSQKIIEKSIIRGRIDLIPNNKIVSRPVDPQSFAAAQSIAKKMDEKIWNPLDLVEFHPDLQKTFDFVFGDKILCSSLELAREIAFNPHIRRICVTKDGDIINPSGLLEGGYTPEGNRFLPKAIEYRKITVELERINRQYDETNNEFQKVREVKENIKKLKKELSELKHNIEVIRGKLNDSKTNEVNLLYENTRKRIQDLKLEEQAKKQHIEVVTAKIQNLKVDMDKKDGNQEKMLQDQMENRKKELIELEKLLKDSSKDLESFRLEIENIVVEEQDANEEMVKIKESLESNSNQAEDIARKINELSEKLKIADEKLQETNKIKKRMEKRTAELQSEKMDIDTDLQSLHDKIKDHEESLIKTKNLLHEFKQKLHDRSQRFSQEIQEEEELDLDEVLDLLKNLEARKDELEKEQQQLDRRVNKDCDAEYNKLKEKYTNVNIMKEQVLENRSVLIENIHGLDEKKKNAVETCFTEVNKNLGLIFSSLLPGAFAEMKMVDLIEKKSQVKYKGIEIRISFNGKWKESLSELSGGQRSLLALSFLLAMLRYRPAPFYILDEVDAALDLSHTENLGALISKHFPQSQFLVISLKEELFNNANVLFKTSVFEGRSKIERFFMKAIRGIGNSQR